MLRIILLFLGVVFFIGGIYFAYSLFRDEKLAASLDKEKTGHGFISGPPPCTWKVIPPERVMQENSSYAILVTVDNTGTEECVSSLTIGAPGFDIIPARNEQTITLSSKRNGSLSWIIGPREAGTYTISVSDIINTSVLGVSVTNTFGLSAMQTKILSIAGTIFGPMLTFPWWLEKLWNRRKQKKVK